MRRLLVLVVGLLVTTVVVLAGWSYSSARADPVVRRATLAMPGWPAGARPVRVALMSDIHIGSPAMDAARLTRIVAQVNALHPDIVLLAGDFVFGHDPANGARYAAELVAPLRGIAAPLGTIAVLGNHDHWTAPATIMQALRRAHVTVLANAAVVRGPLAIAGIDDSFTHHDRVAEAITALRTLRGARVAISHSPDLVKQLPADVPLLLAGHTHCGQVSLPLIGVPVEGGLYDKRYRCGAVRAPGRMIFVTAGLGTSGVPFRLGVPPDLWLIALGP